MRSNNHVLLIGRLGADPEEFRTKNEVPGARLRVATCTTWKDSSGEQRAVTDWHRVVFFGDGTSALPPLAKGQLVKIEGRLQTRSYIGRDDIKRYDTSVVASRIALIDAKDAGDEAGK